MDDADYQNLWKKIQDNTANRSPGSFMRALWYGNNSSVIGQNKGLRKGIRNLPRAAAVSTLGLGGMLPGVSELISFAADTLLDKGKDLYSDRVKPHLRDNPTSWDETHRKAVKEAIKDLKANAFQTIDRNLVKLRDAKNKVEPAIKAFEAAVSSPVPGGGAPPPAVLEAQMKKAQEALRAVAEAEYYVDKVTRLVKVNTKALEGVVKNLDPLKASIQRTQSDLATAIKAAL